MSDARFTDCLVCFLTSMMNLTLNFVGILNYVHHIYDYFMFFETLQHSWIPYSGHETTGYKIYTLWHDFYIRINQKIFLSLAVIVHSHRSLLMGSFRRFHVCSSPSLMTTPYYLNLLREQSIWYLILSARCFWIQLLKVYK
jgi:hypothetical protein